MNSEVLKVAQELLIVLRKYALATPDISYQPNQDVAVTPYSTGTLPPQVRRIVTNSHGQKLVYGQKQTEAESSHPGITAPGVDATNLHRQDQGYLTTVVQP